MKTQIQEFVGMFYWVITEGELTFHSAPCRTREEAERGLNQYIEMQNAGNGH